MGPVTVGAVSYLPVWVLLFVGVVGSVALVARLMLLRSRFRGVSALVATYYRDQTGMLRARSAAVRVGVRSRLRLRSGVGVAVPADDAGSMTGRES